MRSLQFRMTCWVALIATATMVVVLVALNLYALHRQTQSSKKYLKAVARSVAAAAVQAGAPAQPVPPETVASIEDHLAFIDSAGELSVAVVADAGRVLLRTKRFDIPISNHAVTGDHTQLLLHAVGSGQTFDDLFATWRFVYRHREGGVVVFVSDAHHFELAERLAESITVASLVAILLAIPAGYIISRRLLLPFHAIDSAASRVRGGDLRARIDLSAASPEVDRLFRNLNATFAELESSFSRIQQFSADAAHELNTPLTALRGNLEVCLAKERTTEEYQAVLAESVEEVSRLSSMVRDLLLLASPGGADRRARFVMVDLDALVQTTLERLSFIAEESGIRLLSHVAATPVRGDAALLQRALYNLVHNAIRYSPRHAQVDVTVSRRGEGVAIEVKDQGVGIPRERLEQIFERFYRLDPGRTSGAGLGLSLVRWIVDLHKGRIEVESEPGHGSLFRIWLPAEQNTQA